MMHTFQAPFWIVLFCAMAEEDHLRANPRHPPDDPPLPVLRVDLEISVDHSRMFWKENITQTHADCL